MADIDPAPFQEYRQTAEQRRRSLQAQVASRRERAWEVARQAADLLRTEFQVTKVVAFGSLTQPELFHQRSDVDLAVWDLDERLYFRAVGRLQGLDPRIGVDLVMFDDGKPSLRAAIQRDGVEL